MRAPLCDVLRIRHNVARLHSQKAAEPSPQTSVKLLARHIGGGMHRMNHSRSTCRALLWAFPRSMAALFIVIPYADESASRGNPLNRL